jgi:hypothetical protein
MLRFTHNASSGPPACFEGEEKAIPGSSPNFPPHAPARDFVPCTGFVQKPQLNGDFLCKWGFCTKSRVYSDLSQTALLKRGLLLENLTLGWNVVGVILAAYAARPVALAGFGLDSLIEIFASVVVVWQLTGVNLKRERVAFRLIGIAFILLVIYIVAQLLYTFFTGTHLGTSVGGIIWIAATFIAMPHLAPKPAHLAP